MKAGRRFLVLLLAVCGVTGCVIVPRSYVGRPASNVIVYKVDSPPPPRPVGWRRNFTFRYYPGSQVYYAPHRNCYIWKGPRGWITAVQPPPQVALNQADAVTVELENDDPADSHADVVARCANPDPPGPHGSKDRDWDSDKEKGKDRDKGKDKDKDRGRHRGRDRDDD